jgi:hypothetical protein
MGKVMEAVMAEGRGIAEDVDFEDISAIPESCPFGSSRLET